MRTIDIGGTATRISEQSTQDAKSDGFARFINIAHVRNKAGEPVSKTGWQGSIPWGSAIAFVAQFGSSAGSQMCPTALPHEYAVSSFTTE